MPGRDNCPSGRRVILRYSAAFFGPSRSFDGDRMHGRPLKIFFSVGEPSGDLHGANLIRALRAPRPDVECVGYGGPEDGRGRLPTARRPDGAGRDVVSARDAQPAQVSGAWFRRADRYFRHERPDAVVLVDYPGFNWWIARRAKAHGIPVFYYAPPQIWAWASWRVKKMRRFVDHVLCSLPFEETWFRRARLPCDVRRPSVLRRSLATRPRPGVSRRADRPDGRLVTHPARLAHARGRATTCGWFLKAAARIHAAVPDVRFAVASFKPHQAEYARRLVADSGLPIEVYLRPHAGVDRAGRLLPGGVRLGIAGVAATMRKPTVILYHISRLAYFVQSFFRKVKYITLVNLLTAEDVFAERRDAVRSRCAGDRARAVPRVSHL